MFPVAVKSAGPDSPAVTLNSCRNTIPAALVDSSRLAAYLAALVLLVATLSLVGAFISREKANSNEVLHHFAPAGQHSPGRKLSTSAVAPLEPSGQ